MRRLPSSRPSALLWAVLFLLNTGGDGFGLHPCPHHDSPTGHGPAAANAAHADVGDIGDIADIADAADVADSTTSHHEHATGHAALHDEASVDADASQSDSHDGPCTCSGACQAGSAADLPMAAARAPIAAVAAAPVLPVLATLQPLPSRHPPHFLPWGLAPPAHD